MAQKRTVKAARPAVEPATPAPKPAKQAAVEAELIPAKTAEPAIRGATSGPISCQAHLVRRTIPVTEN